MQLIHNNINNLTSLWQQACMESGTVCTEKEFTYALANNSEWPNRLWFNNALTKENISKARNTIINLEPKVVVPVWDNIQKEAPSLLEQHGFTLLFKQTGMVAHLTQPFSLNKQLTYKKIATNSEAEIWTSLFKASFGYQINPVLFQYEKAEFIPLLVSFSGTNIGTGLLYLTQNTAGIHSIGVIPQMRKKGFAEEITKKLMNLAIESNLDYATLQASDMAINIYKRLGFTEQFKQYNYAFDKNH